jgi:tRNA-(ms[2]io[6]A)-hydroxylase
MRRLERKGRTRPQLLDRLLIFSVVEARGYERFAILARGLADGQMREFYAELARSEARHRAVYLRLARDEFGDEIVAPRLVALLEAEAELARSQPIRAALH